MADFDLDRVLVSNKATQLSSAATGDVLTYTVPTGKTAILLGAGARLVETNVIVHLVVNVSVATIRLKTGLVSADVETNVPVTLNAGDEVAWTVATAVVATEFDAFISVEERS